MSRGRVNPRVGRVENSRHFDFSLLENVSAYIDSRARHVYKRRYVLEYKFNNVEDVNPLKARGVNWLHFAVQV